MQNVLYAGTGSARDEGFFYLFLIGVLGLIAGILHLIEFLAKRITRFFEELVSKNACLGMDKDELIIVWLSDKIVYTIQGEKDAGKALKVAEEKIEYLRKGSK